MGKTIELGFLGYDRQRLVIRCSTENLRSQRAAERQGFRRDGVIRANEIIAGRAHDHAIYTLLRSEWHAAHAWWPRANARGVSAPGAQGSSLLA
ncbi:GNAT family N-acetyltransferase [Pseudomonas aeruginosa]